MRAGWIGKGPEQTPLVPTDALVRFLEGGAWVPACTANSVTVKKTAAKICVEAALGTTLEALVP